MLDMLLYTISGFAHYFMKQLFKVKERPQIFKNFTAPNSEIGTPIPVLFGTRAIKAPFVLWYGDLKIIKVNRPDSGKK